MKWKTKLLAGLVLGAALLIWGLRQCTPPNKTADVLDVEYGIRADIKDYIEGEIQDPKIRRGVIQVAQHFQRILNSDPIFFDKDQKTAKSTARILSDRGFKAYGCMRYRLNDRAKYDQISEQLQQRTFNTYIRAKIYLKYNGLLSGWVLKSYEHTAELCE